MDASVMERAATEVPYAWVRATVGWDQGTPTFSAWVRQNTASGRFAAWGGGVYAWFEEDQALAIVRNQQEDLQRYLADTEESHGVAGASVADKSWILDQTLLFTATVGDRRAIVQVEAAYLGEGEGWNDADVIMGEPIQTPEGERIVYAVGEGWTWSVREEEGE
jgi:hypothetical protein